MTKAFLGGCVLWAGFGLFAFPAASVSFSAEKQALFSLAESHFKNRRYKKSLKLWIHFIKAGTSSSDNNSSSEMMEGGSLKNMSLHLAHAHYRAGVLTGLFSDLNRETSEFHKRDKTPRFIKIKKLRYGKEAGDMGGFLLTMEQHFLKAAHQGHPLACYEIGKINYLKGNLSHAFQWFYASLFQSNPFMDSEEKRYHSEVAYWLGEMYMDRPERLPLLALNPVSRLPDLDHSSLSMDESSGMDVNKNKTFDLIAKHSFVQLPDRKTAESTGTDPRQSSQNYMADYWLHHASQTGHSVAQKLLYQHRYKMAKNFRKSDIPPLPPEEKTIWEKQVASVFEKHKLPLPALVQKLKWQDFDLTRLMWIDRVRFLNSPTAQYEWAEISYAAKNFQEAYQWFYLTLQTWKNKHNMQGLLYWLSRNEEGEQVRQAYYKMASMVQHNLVPLKYALRHTLWSEELEKALEVPKFLPFVPSKIKEIRFFQSLPYWVKKPQEADIRLLFSAFLYKKAGDLKHPEALSSLNQLKAQNLDKIHKPPASSDEMNFTFLKSNSKNFSPAAAEGQNGKCSLLFSKIAHTRLLHFLRKNSP